MWRGNNRAYAGACFEFCLASSQDFASLYQSQFYLRSKMEQGTSCIMTIVFV